MLLNTQGIVLHTVNYSETSVVAKIFTRHLGGRSFLIKGVNKGKSRTKRNLLQPLTYLDMTVNDQSRRQLQYVKEMQPALQWMNCATDYAKTSVLFFINEVLYKVLKDDEPNPALFDYIVREVEQLNGTEGSLQHYPAFFLLRLSSYLGIVPLNNYSTTTPRFHMREGRFMAPPARDIPPQEAVYYVDAQTSTWLHAYMAAAQGQTLLPGVPPATRRQLLEVLLQYYRVHIPDFATIKSVEVLHQVLA